jgi:hypothetical protein
VRAFRRAKKNEEEVIEKGAYILEDLSLVSIAAVIRLAIEFGGNVDLGLKREERLIS